MVVHCASIQRRVSEFCRRPRRALRGGWPLFVWLSAATSALAAGRVEFAWPTPSTAWEQGRPAAEFLQHAGSGDPESGGYGGVRSGGAQFHEGIDIKPVKRDRRGEPADAVFAALDGVVRHISTTAGNSSYGRYIVLEHPDQDVGVYTLYAHLARIEPGLKRGDTVQRGRTIGLMGHTAGGYVIPRDRAHLHFEIGLMMTRDFQRWYDSRKFGSRNEHGLWNGMNLMGIDVLDFLQQWRDRRVNTFGDYFARMEPSLRVRIATARVPDFASRYPTLLSAPLPAVIAGWEIACNGTGVPFRWTPLTGTEAMGLRLNEPMLRDVNANALRRDRSKSLAVLRRGQWVEGRDLETVLQQLFGLR